LCDRVLRSLPEWFGIEQAIVDYVTAVESMPTFVASHNGQEIGFLSIKQHFPDCAEAYVLGILPAHHRQGAGRAMFAVAEQWMRGQGVRFLQVKTLAPTAKSDYYDRTREFYETIGFTPLEVFPTLWSERNTCMLMIKSLAPPSANGLP
jgi:GNAT superfamily N-acetyltransferase